MGQVRSNIRKGGGVTFAKTRTHEHFRKDMPKKMRQLANRNALLAKLVDGEVKCIVDLDFAKPKTSDFKAILELTQSEWINSMCLNYLITDT